jgi:hypothetical protein
MEEHKLRRIRIRRGLDSQRKEVVFEEGELVYSIDKKRVYVGDDQTYGGNLVSNKNYITLDTNKPIDAQTGDIFFDKVDKSTFLIDFDGSVKPVTSSLVTCCTKIQNDIDIIDNLLKRLSSECCNPDNYLATDLDTPSFEDFILTDSGYTIMK